MRLDTHLASFATFAAVTGLILFTACQEELPSGLGGGDVSAHHQPGHGGGPGGGSNEFSASLVVRDAEGDRITSQGSPTYEDDVDGNLRIRDDGILLWNVDEGRGFVLDFSDVITGGDDLPSSSTVGRVGSLRVLASEDNQDELDGHLLGMENGESLPAMFKTRAEFDASGTYQLRFQRPAGDATIDDSIATGSSFLTIVRNGSEGACATVSDECWTIEARVTGAGSGTQDDWSMVFHRTGQGGNTAYTDEGSFHMPFRWTVICPGCPPASGDADEPPAVAVTNPSDGSTVSGSVDVTAEASDDGSVTQVEFFVDGGSIGIDSDGLDGWSASWNTTGVADGDHAVSATAIDDAGQTASDEVSVTVNNVDDLPSVAVTNPADGTTVSGVVEVTADATDDGSVSQVEFFVDGVSLGVDSDGSDSWSASWDTNGLEDGSSHTAGAIATDDAGQTASDEVTVTVDNSGPSTLHVGDLDGDSSNQGRAWTATVDALVLDDRGNPVADATVSGSWSGGASGSAACTTGSDGRCPVSEGGIRKNVSSVTFTVEDVAHADLFYDAAANTDPDGDSDGTAITVGKP